MKSSQKTIAVIGAGIVGVNCAAELQSLGFQVTLLDKEGIGEGCSKGNAGHFATEQVFPLAEASLLWQLPKLLLDPLGPVRLSPKYLPKAIPWFIKFIANMSQSKRAKNSKALKSLNKNAIHYYQQLFQQANCQHLLTTKGSLLVFEDTPKNQVNKQYHHYANAGIAVELLNRRQVLELEPNLSEKIQYALYFTNVAHTIDPFDVCQAIANFAKSKGAIFTQFKVKSIRQAQAQVIIGDGINELSFDQVVVATGAWSKDVLKQLGYKLPMEVERGYSLNLTKPTSAEVSPELNRPVASAERRFIMTPMAQGLRLSGTVEFAGLNQKANMQRADMLYQHATKMLTSVASFDAQNADENQRWLGFRPSLPDSLPVICQATQHSNIYFALGHQHLGLTLGAITGKLIGQIVTGKPTDIDVSPFSIGRFN